MSSPLSCCPPDIADGALEPGRVFGLLGGPCWWGSATRVTTGPLAGMIRIQRQIELEGKRFPPRFVAASQRVYVRPAHG